MKSKRRYIAEIITIVTGLVLFLTEIKDFLIYMGVKDFLVPELNKNLNFELSQHLSTIAYIESGIILVILIIGTVITNKELKLIKNSIHRYNLKRFYYSLIIILASWVLIYFWLGVAWGDHLNMYSIMRNKSFIWCIVDFFHSFTILGFFYGFFTLRFPFSNDEEGNLLAKKSSFQQLGIVIVITFFIYIYSTSGRYYGFGMDKLGVVLLAILSGISMQYFLNALISIKSTWDHLLIAPLYLYVLIQVFWVAVEDIMGIEGKYLILIIALFCKIIFISAIFYWTSKKFISDYFNPNKPTKPTLIE